MSEQATISTSGAFRQPESPTEFRAIGIMRGQFIPKTPGNWNGDFIMPQGEAIPASLLPQCGIWLQKQEPSILQEPHEWTVYPCMQNQGEGSKLSIQIKGVNSPKGNPGEYVDYFSIRGVIIQQNTQDGLLTVRIERNCSEKKKQLPYMQPFTLDIEGFLPGNAINQFWSLDCTREGDRFILEDAQKIDTPAP